MAIDINVNRSQGLQFQQPNIDPNQGKRESRKQLMDVIQGMPSLMLQYETLKNTREKDKYATALDRVKNQIELLKLGKGTPVLDSTGKAVVGPDGKTMVTDGVTGWEVSLDSSGYPTLKQTEGVTPTPGTNRPIVVPPPPETNLIQPTDDKGLPAGPTVDIGPGKLTVTKPQPLENKDSVIGKGGKGLQRQGYDTLGHPVSFNPNTGEEYVMIDGKLKPWKGGPVIPPQTPTPAYLKQKTSLQMAKQTISQLEDAWDVIQKQGKTGLRFSTLVSSAKGKAQQDPDVAKYQALREALIVQIGRNIGTDVGNFTEQEQKRYRKMLASLYANDKTAKGLFSEIKSLSDQKLETLDKTYFFFNPDGIEGKGDQNSAPIETVSNPNDGNIEAIKFLMDNNKIVNEQTIKAATEFLTKRKK